MTENTIRKALGNHWQIKELPSSIFLATSDQLDHMNDFIELGIKCDQNDSLTITDDCQTLSELELSGLDIQSSRCLDDIMHEITDRHGITIENTYELTKQTNIFRLSTDTNDFIDCIREIIKELIARQ